MKKDLNTTFLYKHRASLTCKAENKGQMVFRYSSLLSTPHTVVSFVFLMLISPRFTPTAALSAFLQLLSFIFTAGVRDDYL